MQRPSATRLSSLGVCNMTTPRTDTRTPAEISADINAAPEPTAGIPMPVWVMASIGFCLALSWALA